VELGGTDVFTWTPEGQSTELMFTARSLDITDNGFDDWDVRVQARQEFA
jgi:hypothetical protein